jgi:hypothetical protein
VCTVLALELQALKLIMQVHGACQGVVVMTLCTFIN